MNIWLSIIGGVTVGLLIAIVDSLIDIKIILRQIRDREGY